MPSQGMKKRRFISEYEVSLRLPGPGLIARSGGRATGMVGFLLPRVLSASASRRLSPSRSVFSSLDDRVLRLQLADGFINSP